MALTPLSPVWWVYKLHRKLVDRQVVNEKLQRYYSGDFDVPWLAPQAREEFQQVIDLAKANVCGLIVDSTAERLAVEGFRLGPDDQDADAETWRIWQANDLDATFDQGILETLICGTSYLLVGPNAADERTPRVWVEHPSQAIVAFVAGTNRRQRAAGLKIWQDEWTGRLHSTLYLPDRIFRWESEGRASAGRPEVIRWAPRLLDGVSEDSNPLGKVPLYEVANRPRLLTGGVSELADVMVIQDRINKTLVDRLLTQDFGAFPQKNVSGWPTLDEQGNKVPQIEIGRNRLVSTSALGVQFGQWDAAPLDPYSAAKREDTKDAASRTRTPAQYLLGEMSNVNGECLELSTPIPTPTGMVPIGNIRGGDSVFDELGQVQTVEAAHPVLYDRPCYRITFDDGTAFVADSEHRWPVVSIPESKRSLRGIAQRTIRSDMRTEDIAATLLCANGQKTHAIDLAAAPDGPERAFVVDPYVLGAWLGDGSRGSSVICAGEQDVAEMVHHLEAAGESVKVRQDGRGLYWLTLGRDGLSLRARLKTLGIMDRKRIPEEYYTGSQKQRLALLQGLMDTDGTAVGHARQGGAVALGLHDGPLARDARRLICSLGHKVSLRESPFTRIVGGKVVSGIRYGMRWVPPDLVFRLDRKIARQSVQRLDRPKHLRRTIMSVEPVESVPVRCLTVSGPSHLFLIGVEHVPTHNTLKASESGQVSKCRQTQRFMSDPLEDGMRDARQLAGLTGPGDAGMETIWRDPQYRTEGERADATVKKVQAGIISMRQAREDLGYSQTQIARMEADIANEAVDATVERILRAPVVA